MKKLLITFLILFSFSNNVFAFSFGDFFKDFFGIEKPAETLEKSTDANNVRCKVEYTQLDLNTGIEKSIKHTSQLYIDYLPNGGNVCYLVTQDLSDKINIWMKESENNVVANMTVVNCKERSFYISRVFFWESEDRWGEYKSCDDEFNMQLVDWIERPEQLGFNVNKARLIRDYEEGFKNYYGDSLDGQPPE
jgi:hypothetical protein